MKTIGFIGTGNMSQAIIDGMMTSQIIAADQVVLFNRTQAKAEAIAQKYSGMSVAESMQTVMDHCRYIVLGMKPNQYEGVIEQIKKFAQPHHVIITIAAGIEISKIRYWFGDEVKVVRTMPNTPAKVGAGMTAISFSDRLNDEEQQFAITLMTSFGLSEVIDEKYMDIVPAISGSSPAYFFMILEAMGDEGVRQGLSRDQAYRMAAQAMVGAGRMFLETGMHPGVLKDQVTSPGGTTIEAVKSLEANGLRSAMMTAMGACTTKVEVLKKSL